MKIILVRNFFHWPTTLGVSEDLRSVCGKYNIRTDFPTSTEHKHVVYTVPWKVIRGRDSEETRNKNEV